MPCKQIEDQELCSCLRKYTSSTIHLIGIGFLEKNKNHKGETILEIDARWKHHKE